MNANTLKRALRDTVAPVTRKLRRLINRSLLRRVSYSGKMRLLQIQGEGGQLFQDIEHLEPFGFTSHPLPGAEPIVLALNGNGSHTVVILVNDQRYRLVLEEGESAIYNHHGDKVHIKKDRTIEVKTAVRVTLDTPEVVCTGTLNVADTITAGGNVTGLNVLTDAGISLGSHTHLGDSGGTTGAPT